MRGGQERPDSGLRSDARRNQQRILRAAARLLAADPASTIQQIADEAEVARPTVYRRYPTREALVEAIIAEATAEFAVALDDVASQAGSAAEAIGQLIRQLARISADYPILLSGPDGAHPPGDGTRREMAALVSRFDAQIARGQQDRSVRTDLAPEVLRHSLFGALSMSMRLRQQQPAGTRLGPDEIGEQVTSLFMEGLRPRCTRRARQGRPGRIAAVPGGSPTARAGSPHREPDSGFRLPATQAPGGYRTQRIAGNRIHE